MQDHEPDSKEGTRLSQEVRAAQKEAAPAGRPEPAVDKVASDELAELVRNSLDDDKAEDVVTIDLQGKSDLADHMIIASGRSTRQVVSICEKLIERIKHQMGIVSRVEGKDQGDWVLIDAGDVIVHVFRPEVRNFYQLEKMWMPAARDSSAD